MTYPCELIELPTQPTLHIRTRTAIQGLSDALGEAYGKIAKHLGEIGSTPAGPAYTAYYNMDMQDLDVEIGFPVQGDVSGSGEILLGEMPAGKYAACLYTGPYEKIEPAYTSLGKWIQENGFESTGVAYEEYLNDPALTPPDQLQTRILFPLKS